MTERKQGETPDEHHLSQWPRPTSRVISADYDVDSIHSWCDMMKMALYLGGLPPHNYKPSLPGKSHGWRSLVGCSPWGHCLAFTFHFHALEKEMATHSSVLAWRIPGTAEPGGLLSIGLHRVGSDWSDAAEAGWTGDSIVNLLEFIVLDSKDWKWLSFLDFI